MAHRLASQVSYIFIWRNCVCFFFCCCVHCRRRHRNATPNTHTEKNNALHSPYKRDYDYDDDADDDANDDNEAKVDIRDYVYVLA